MPPHARLLISPCRALPKLGSSSYRTIVTSSKVAAGKATLTLTSDENESSSGLTGADKLLHDALQLEKEEEESISNSTRVQDPNDPIWTGEERVQDTVLRMVMDKYKPLRLAVDSNRNAADEKIKASIQTCSSFSPSNSPFGGGEGVGLFVAPGYDGEHEDGRRLPKTPDEKPWRAVYVRPASAMLGAEEGFKPSIYYGQFLKSHNSPSQAPALEMRSKLKAAGLNPSSLPLDDPKAMLKLRAEIKTAERRGKLLRARNSVLDYQLSSSSSSPSEGKGDQLSDTNQNLQLQLGHAQGWDSVVEKRIKAAYDAGLFKENKFRGQPLKRDMEEKNPFLAREEYFINRIVKRQGAAPPWVELNMELEDELASWRRRVEQGWIRRASRMITTSNILSASLEPLRDNAGDDEGGESDGEKALWDTAKRYRDLEWEQRERSFHEHELKRLNELIRKHNHLAPFTARKRLIVLDIELGQMYESATPKLAHAISAILRQKTNSNDRGSKDGWDEHLKQQAGTGGVPTYDMWGREIKPPSAEGKKQRGALQGWWGTAVGSKSEEKFGDVGRKGAERGEEGVGGKEGQVQNLGLLAAIQQSLQWAREKIGA